MTDIRTQMGLDAAADLERALGTLRRLTGGLHLPGVSDALDDAWRALGAMEAALGQPEDLSSDDKSAWPAPG